MAWIVQKKKSHKNLVSNKKINEKPFSRIHIGNLPLHIWIYDFMGRSIQSDAGKENFNPFTKLMLALAIVNGRKGIGNFPWTIRMAIVKRLVITSVCLVVFLVHLCLWSYGNAIRNIKKLKRMCVCVCENWEHIFNKY